MIEMTTRFDEKTGKFSFHFNVDNYETYKIVESALQKVIDQFTDLHEDLKYGKKLCSWCLNKEMGWRCGTTSNDDCPYFIDKFSKIQKENKDD